MLFSWLLSFSPHVFILFGAACLLGLFGGLPLLLRRADSGAAAVPAQGEVVDFAEHEPNQADTLGTRVLVRFRTAAGHTIVGVAAVGRFWDQLHFRRGQRVAVRYNPANPRQVVMPTVEAARRTFRVVVFCLVGAGLLGLSVLLFLLSALLPGA
ncbi:DUF3592 domain-containing protein [Hymenobacter jeollabukensis]|uniref:DUF3592 domain-containing protein n=1 Tax=Hymenobacter jeollabukensis TaxID=2025313 RepID=A0A5R8WP29_9BACT|nr:DUF3592 domain-containing protein [Hymenobacter jeollabukensis]TLM91172.1 DUF3592 domain-containing protein [Hymenobacter jeollabukensis]